MFCKDSPPYENMYFLVASNILQRKWNEFPVSVKVLAENSWAILSEYIHDQILHWGTDSAHLQTSFFKNVKSTDWLLVTLSFVNLHNFCAIFIKSGAFSQEKIKLCHQIFLKKLENSNIFKTYYMFLYFDLKLGMMSPNLFGCIITIDWPVVMQSFKDISFVVPKKQRAGGFPLPLMENMNFSFYGG